MIITCFYAIDPRYKLNFFPETLKNTVKRLLKSEVKNLGCRETCQSVILKDRDIKYSD